VKIKKIQFFILSILVLGIINIPCFSLAENQIDVTDGDINVSINPSNPIPYENITITISSYSTDLNKASISWQSENNTPLSGIGKTSYTIKAGAADISIPITININPVGGTNTITKQIYITPSEMDIMWEAVDGYTPPFYKGKSLPTSGSLIKVVAIPSSNTIKTGSGSITYTWKNSDSVVEDASGYNKNYYTFKNSLFDNTNNISVTASSVSGNYNAEKDIEIPVYKPKIVFYKKSPTEGIVYDNALTDNSFMSEDEMTIVAEPYFISLKGNENKFLYTWQINGKNIDTPQKRTELTIRPSTRGGYAKIGLTMENLSELFQKVSGQLKLEL